jgi:phosphatidate cytidylyltransferase
MEPQINNPDDSGEDTVKPARWSGLGTRILSAIVLGIVSFICIWLGGIAFTALVMLMALVMKKEWDALISGQPLLSRALGYVYVILPCASLLWIRNLPGEAGLGATVTLIGVISATDIGAYFVGRRFGKHKLSPIISPNKTWEGLAGGIIAALIAAVLLSPYIPIEHTLRSVLWMGPFIAILAQAGDLFESSLKRQAGVKDSGTILPGHGGLLDRFDGYMFATPVFAVLLHSALLTA